MVIVVLGMHRSGTSLISSMLHAMGVRMGREFLPEDEGNPNGYWEDPGFLGLNKAILMETGGDWDRFVTRKQVLGVEEKFKDRIQELIEDREHSDPGRSLWGWKDPRTCMSIWLWHKYLRSPRYVIVRRSRLGVIRSLRKLHGKRQWHDLIVHYDRHVNAFLSIHQPTFYSISYDDLVSKGEFAVAAAVGLASFVNRAGMAYKAMEQIRHE